MSHTSPSKRQPVRKAQGSLVLVLGGASSGKSEAALQLAGRTAPKAFIATGQGLDDEMIRKIARHRASRSVEWKTAEVPVEVEAWLRKEGARYRTILFDCVTLWLSNLIGARKTEASIRKRVAGVLEAMRATGARVVIVSNELGLGLVPAEPATRVFRDLAGKVNQQIAAEADEVHFIVSGLPLQLK